jgi:hypothetical protein
MTNYLCREIGLDFLSPLDKLQLPIHTPLHRLAFPLKVVLEFQCRKVLVVRFGFLHGMSNGLQYR